MKNLNVFNEVAYVNLVGRNANSGRTWYANEAIHNEIMVHFNENGKILGMYTYKDSIGKRFENWKPGQNPLFIHCPESELESAIVWLKFNAIKCGED